MNSQQLNLFDSVRRPMVLVPINPNGEVLRKDPDFTMTLRHPRLAWHRAKIEIHRHTNGLWMWSASWQSDNSGRGYRVGEKWGKFAETKEDALFYAAQEIEDGLDRKSSSDAALIVNWALSLKDNAKAFK